METTIRIQLFFCSCYGTFSKDLFDSFAFQIFRLQKSIHQCFQLVMILSQQFNSRLFRFLDDALNFDVDLASRLFAEFAVRMHFLAQKRMFF